LALAIEVHTQLGQARAALRQVRYIAEHPRPLLEIAGQLLEDNWRDRFRTGRGPNGVPWKPSGRTVQGGLPQGKRVGPSQGGRTLVNKGGLVSSLTHIAEDTRVQIGIIAKTTSAKFGYVHQFGATITPKRAQYLVFRAPDGHTVFAKQVTIPARPFIGIDEQDRVDLAEAWSEHVGSLMG
jgi:phage gpG-like protein